MLDEIEGVIQGHRDGHGYVVRDDGEGDIYLPPNEMRAVLHKDRVKARIVRHDRKGVFAGLPEGFSATRYHSLAVERETLPGCLEVSAQSEEGEIMGLRHRSLPVEGVQFHPEALLTEHGHAMLKNFLEGRRT